uniref:ShKT domain-containing protein n=1 Tax=Panagrolaimus sp. ES5 TaxID=591445 RepID=A0AC34GAM5_9BILA
MLDKTSCKTPVIERLCLNQSSIEYQKDSEHKVFSSIDECSIEGKVCQHFLFICEKDNCNMNCGINEVNLPSSTSTTTSTSTPSTTTTIPKNPSNTVPPSITTPTFENGGNFAAISFYLFGLFTLAFSAIF